MSALGDTLQALADVFDRRGLRWVVFGAQAVTVRGAPRATQDVDVSLEVERSELGAVVSELQVAGLHHRYPELADELLESGAVLPLLHTSGMEVDLVLAGSGLEALALSRAERMLLDGISVPVAQVTDLVVMKVLAGRGKDWTMCARCSVAGTSMSPRPATCSGSSSKPSTSRTCCRAWTTHCGSARDVEL